jgi:chromate transporter
VIPAPYFKRYGRLPAVAAFVDGITAAAVGAIAGPVVIIAKRTIVDLPTALTALATIVLPWRFRKLQEPVLIAAAAILGLVAFPLLAKS